MRINNAEELEEAKTALKMIRKAILERATGQTVQTYTIGSRNITHALMSYTDLKKLEQEYITAIGIYEGKGVHLRGRFIPCD